MMYDGLHMFLLKCVFSKLLMCVLIATNACVRSAYKLKYSCVLSLIISETLLYYCEFVLELCSLVVVYCVHM